jgi:Fe/S biogenesis protein NfuA
MVDVTLRHGIEALIREEIPEIQQVVDTTDHASGQNPYYQPAKG